MKVIKKLLFRPERYKDESLSGYLLRASQDLFPLKYIVSELHLFEDIQRGSQNYNIDFKDLSRDDLYYLAALSLSSRENISDMLIRNHETKSGYYHFYNDIAHSSSFSTIKAKVCPYCLADEMYFRKVWHHINVLTCPYHDILLIDKCCACNEIITWKKSNIFKCSCGYEHSNAQAPQAPEECRILSMLIYQKLGLSNEVSLPLEQHFTNITLHELDDIYFLLASFIGRLRLRQQFTSTKITVEEISNIQIVVMEILLNWLEGFHRFQDEIKTNQRNESDTKVCSTFGNFYIQLVKDRRKLYEIGSITARRNPLRICTKKPQEKNPSRSSMR